MKIKTSLFIYLIIFYGLFNIGCVNKENKNLVKESDGRDPRIDNFFNAIGIQLKNVNGNDFDEVSAELTKISPLFTNALPPKIGGRNEPRPFMILTKNVGEYFASQIWKTQITSTDDVRFFNLSNNLNDAQSGIQYLSSDFDLKGIFLNPYAEKDPTKDPKNYLGSVENGYYVGGSREKISHFYIMEYKLRDENGSKFSDKTRTYYALLSIPENENKTKQYRVIMYAHGGDYGTSSAELINIFGDKLGEFIVVAPAFPGEPLCMQIAKQGIGCMRFDAQNNLILDDKGQYHNSSIAQPLHSVVPLNYPRSPLMEDINAFLGAHNAVARMMGVANDANPFYHAAFERNQSDKNKSIILAIEHPEALNKFVFDGSDIDLGNMIPTGLAPQTIAAGSSRGGGVLMAAIGRIGFLLNPISLEAYFPSTIEDAPNEMFEFQYPLFNGAVMIASPTSMITGKMRLLTIMVMQNEIESIAALPMASDLANNKFIVNYRKDDNYLSELQLTSFQLDDSGSSFLKQDTLSQFITFIASNDITFLAPFMATGLQNWNSYYYSYDEDENFFATRAPGSLALFHGSQDLVVPMTESTIAAQAMSMVWAGLYNTTIDPLGNHLHEAEFELIHSLLAQSAIPGTGVAQYTFQPTNQFFNVPCDRSTLASIQQPNVIYNTNVNRCFGGGYSEHADGTEVTGGFNGHLDPSFFTGRLVNNISSDNLHTAVLSSNKIGSIDDLTMRSDEKINMRLNLCDRAQDDDCTILPNSPTFMRYMSAEGMPNSNVVNVRKQIFEGEFNPLVGLLNEQNSKDQKKIITPHEVLFAWLDNVACDKDCKTPDKLFIERSGVFHDYYRD